MIPVRPPRPRESCSACALPVDAHRVGVDSSGALVIGYYSTGGYFHTCADSWAGRQIAAVLEVEVVAPAPRPPLTVIDGGRS
jgi:hypothetical protein